MKNEIAILMAAGMGVRMRPLTNKIPKPLVKVQGVPLIETIIEGLQRRQVAKIYVVVGYLKEQFLYLNTKYDNVYLIENKEYAEKNNISSLYAVRRILGSANCFICEADLYVTDKEIFEEVKEGAYSCYFGKLVEGYSDDWVFEVNGTRIIRIKKGGTDLYNMAGISYWKKKDALHIKEAIEKAYEETGHEQLFWDEIVDRELKKMVVSVQEIHPKAVIEIDTIKELQELGG